MSLSAWCRRILFAAGTVQALAAAAGGPAPQAAAQWLDECPGLWGAAAAVARAAAIGVPGAPLSTAVQPAVAAADDWAAETGAPAAWHAIL